MTNLMRVLVLLSLMTTCFACGDDDGEGESGSGATGGDSGEGGAGTGGDGGSAGTAGTGGDGGSAGTAGTGGDEDGGAGIGVLIGPQGGEVVLTDDGVDQARVQIPVGALTIETLFAIEARDVPPTALPEFIEQVSPYYTITPHGTQFEAPVTVALKLSDNVLIQSADVISIWTLADDEDLSWEQVDVATVVEGHAIFTTDHFSGFAAGRARSSGSICIPMCGLNECGPDMCGRQCGTCDSGEGCRAGFCEAASENCNNRIDDDNNGATDCNDNACGTASNCTRPEICTNDSDDDGDQSVDCDDSDCASAPNCQVDPEICNNGINDDDDNSIDCADSDCASSCGNLNVDWTLQLNGSASTCQATGGDTVAITATNDATGLEYTATAVCSQATTTLIVPAGTYDIALVLQAPGPSTIANATVDNAIVPGGGNGNPDPATFSVTSSTCAQVVISRIYNAGGFGAAGYNHDFVELHNRTTSPIDISGWSLQTRINNGNSGWVVTPLGNGMPNDSVIAAGGFWLIELGRDSFSSGEGMAIPSPDTIGASSTDISGYSTDVVLRNTTSSVADDVCPGSAIDAFGNVCGEGSGLIFGQSETSMIHRPDGCTDLDNNSADFTSTTLTTPRNSSTTAATCPACN